GGGNAITDIYIDGNVLTPAKNKNFVDMDQYQRQDNNSVFPAGGGMKTISDIYANVDLTNTGISNIIDEDDTLLIAKADQTQLALISLIEDGNVDLTNYYNKTKTDELLDVKLDTVYLDKYNIPGILLSITENKTFNNCCRFVSEIDGMLTVTVPSFIKSGTEDTVVLLVACSTKPISEFRSRSIDDQNYYANIQNYSKPETVNKYVRLEGTIQQIIISCQKCVNLFGETYYEAQDPVDNTYWIQSEIKSKLINYVETVNYQSINGTKTFNANANATCFVKTVNDDTTVLLAGGGERVLSLFGEIYMGINASTSDASVAVFTLENADFQIYIYSINDATGGGFSWQLKTHTSMLHILQQFERNNGAIGNVYLDEALLNAAGLSDFPELYVYIRERYQEPVPPAQRVPIGEETLQKQVKDNDDILFSSNEVFVPPLSNAPTKLDLISQLERSSFIALSGLDPQLIVYGDRVTLTASYETTGLFLNGYLFKSYPVEARPKAGDKVIALVGTVTTNKNIIFCYIDQNGPFIISTSQIPSKTALVINVTYYKKYESSKIINYDANNDGIINILDTWHVNGKGTFETSSYVYETVEKQTDLIATGLFGDVKVNYLNSDIKLMDELAIYKADRAAFFIKEGPFITFSFGAKLGQIIQQYANSKNQQTVHRLFSTITQKLLPPNTKYMPVRTEQQEYTAMCLFKDIYDKSLAVEVAVSGVLNKNDCEFQGTYILDNYKNPTLNEESNEEPNASPSDPKQPDSHIDEVIIKHDKLLTSASQPIYTITNVFNQIRLNAPFDQGGHAYNTFYIVDDGTCKV
ncbi:MAG: hypothetical protein EZS28_028418, partial [Streblomastix strix]